MEAVLSAEQGKYLMVPMYKAVTLMENMVRTSFRKIQEHKKEGPIIAAEIGVYEGENASVMLILCPRMKLYCIDHYTNMDSYSGGPRQEPQFYEQIKRIAAWNLKRFNGNAQLMILSSEQGSKEFVDGFFDYVYIDGEHTYDAVKKDLELWYPKVKVGGMIAGHDVGMVEVSMAVDELVAKHKISPDKWGKDPVGGGRSDFWIFK